MAGVFVCMGGGVYNQRFWGGVGWGGVGWGVGGGVDEGVSVYGSVVSQSD